MQHPVHQLRSGDGGSNGGADAGSPPALPLPADLEMKLEKQRLQLAGAISMLQEAAHLARYHQPPLERAIRAFLEEMER